MSSLRPKVDDPKSEEPPLAMRVVNHLLTPGSSLTSTVWTAFNAIMLVLGVIWIVFLFNFPTNPHVLVFGGLFLGLLASTNWFFKEIFDAKEDFESRKARGEINNEKGGSAAAVEQKAKAEGADDAGEQPQPTEALAAAEGVGSQAAEGEEKGSLRERKAARRASPREE